MSKAFVNVHIEKTAGTSVGRLLNEHYGEDRVLRYDAVSDRVIRQSDRIVPTGSVLHKIGRRAVGIEYARTLVKPVVQLGHTTLRNIDRLQQRSPEHMPRDFDILTGHFSATRFSDILPPDEYAYTTILRDPLVRMRSHYEHWQRAAGVIRFRVRPSFDPDMRFEDFALLPEMANYQSQAVGIDPSQYHKIGVIDHLDAYLEDMGWKELSADTPRVNVAHYAQPSVDPGFLRDFNEAHGQDIALYEATKALWE